MAIHKDLFRGIYKHAGQIRTYNITKKEWVLDGSTVLYGPASELRAALGYDLSQEKSFTYKGLSMDETIRHLAVFFIKYLRTLGFDVTNDIFAENAMNCITEQCTSVVLSNQLIKERISVLKAMKEMSE